MEAWETLLLTLSFVLLTVAVVEVLAPSSDE